MKKLLISITTIISVYGADMLMPPPPIPTLQIPTKHKQQKIKKQQDKCSLIPPMLINIPPMLQDDLTKCKNKLYMPQKKVAKNKLEKLLKRKVIIKKIENLKNFSMLYKITTNNGIFICNKNIDSCFINPHILQMEQK